LKPSVCNSEEVSHATTILPSRHVAVNECRVIPNGGGFTEIVAKLLAAVASNVNAVLLLTVAKGESP
jgi:hypothetical protein